MPGQKWDGLDSPRIKCRGEQMRVIVAGAVAWSDAHAIRRELSKIPIGATVIHGDCAGADIIAGQVAREMGFAVEAMNKNEEDYTKYGHEAWKGLNERMLASGARLVIVFHPSVANSHGSKHMIELAQAANVEVRSFSN